MTTESCVWGCWKAKSTFLAPQQLSLLTLVLNPQTNPSTPPLIKHQAPTLPLPEHPSQQKRTRAETIHEPRTLYRAMDTTSMISQNSARRGSVNTDVDWGYSPTGTCKADGLFWSSGVWILWLDRGRNSGEGFPGGAGGGMGMEGATVVVQELNGVFFSESEISEWHG